MGYFHTWKNFDSSLCDRTSLPQYCDLLQHLCLYINIPLVCNYFRGSKNNKSRVMRFLLQNFTHQMEMPFRIHHFLELHGNTHIQLKILSNTISKVNCVSLTFLLENDQQMKQIYEFLMPATPSDMYSNQSCPSMVFCAM